jgi:hypothetical protein
MGTVWLVCDTSGSMIEGGKRLIMRGLVRQVEQFLRLGYGPKQDLKLVLWNDVATSPAWNPSDEVPHELMDCKGSAVGDALVQFLGTFSGGKILILTDGFWPEASRDAIKRWKAGATPDAVRIVKVGADANPRLKGSDVFEAEDFIAAMDGWLDR